MLHGDLKKRKILYLYNRQQQHLKEIFYGHVCSSTHFRLWIHTILVNRIKSLIWSFNGEANYRVSAALYLKVEALKGFGQTLVVYFAVTAGATRKDCSCC